MSRSGAVAPKTPAHVTNNVVDHLFEATADEMWAQLPQENERNLALYLAACDGCESSLELMREQVWARWDALGLI